MLLVKLNSTKKLRVCNFIIIKLIQYALLMANNLKKFPLLPNLESRAGNQRIQSLSRFSSELNTISVNQNQSALHQNNKLPKRSKYRSITQPRQVEQLKQCKTQLQKLRNLIEQKKKQKSTSIDDKINKLSRLVTREVAQSLQTPRSSYNYINLSQPAQQMQPTWSLNMQPPINPINYMHPAYFNPYNYPPSYPKYFDHEDPSRGNSRKKERRRYRTQNRSEVSDKSIYNDYEHPQKYSKLRQTRTTIKSKIRPNLNIYHKNMRNKLKKKWRAVAWAIAFTIWLPKYSKKIMQTRLNNFNKFRLRSFNSEMMMFQKYMVKKCKPFFLYILNRQDFEIAIQDSQTFRMEDEKAQAAKRMISMLIQGISSIQFQDTNEPGVNPIQLIHLFCKHGAFVAYQFMTEEELQMNSVSQKYGYLRMDRHLEKSQIINFICYKIILYNCILNPTKVDKKQFSSENQILTKNLYFVGSIWYELCLEIQDLYLCQASSAYDLGNWGKYRKKFDIQPSKPLTVNGKMPQKDEMISGLLGKKKIDDLFGANFWRKQKNNLKAAIQYIHGIIVKFHERLVSEVKF